MAHLPINKVTSGAGVSGNPLVAGMVSAESSGDTFDSHEGVYAHAENDGGADITITIKPIAVDIPTSEAQRRVIADMTVVVPYTSDVGVFFEVPPAYISGGKVKMKYSSVTGLTIGVFEVTND